MRKKIRRRILTCCLALLIGAQSVPVYAMEEEQVQTVEVQSEDGEQTGGGEQTEGDEQTGGSENTESSINAVSDEVYDALNLPLTDPEEFDSADTSNPLDGYQTQILSELYLGEMNRDKDWTGSFKVMENVTNASADSFNIDEMEKSLVGGDTAFPYATNDDDKEVQTHNACGMDYDGDGLDEIVDVTLYVDKTKSPDTSYIDLTIYDREGEGDWQKKDTMTKALTNKSSDDPDYVNQIEADSSKALTSIVAGDFNQDGKEECAVYMPSYGVEDPGVLIISAEGGTISLLQKIELKSLSEAFNMTYVSWMLPSVSLATTQISGQDDLVISASLPLKSDDGYEDSNQNSVTSIYRYNSKNNKLYSTGTSIPMMYEDGYRMRFASATDADLNGNGVKELLIGGYKNYGYSSKDPVGKLSEDENLLMMVCWEDGRYVTEWSQPKEIPALQDAGLRVDAEVMEPAAMAAGRFLGTSQSTQVFLEGIVFGYKKDTATTASTESEYYKDCKFEQLYQMELDGNDGAFISTATAASFSTNQIALNQLVILCGDHVNLNDDNIYYDIGWIWTADNKSLTGAITANDYFDKADEDDNGTFLSICALDVDTDTMHIKYTGKEFGWSKPVVYAVLQSAPFWNELQYSEEIGRGESTVDISCGYENGHEGEWGVGLGLHASASVMVGAGFLGTEAETGIANEFAVLASYIGSYSKIYETKQSIKYTEFAGTDCVILLAVPIVIYNYEVLVPAHVATDSEVESYQTLYPDTPCPFKAGEEIEQTTEEMSVSQQLDPTSSKLELEQYNEIVKKLDAENKDSTNKIGLTVIGDSDLPQKEIGDPSTYPSPTDEIWKTAGIKNFTESLHTTTVAPGNGTVEFEHETTKTTEQANGFELEFEDNLSLKLEATTSFLLASKTELEIGAAVKARGGCTWMQANSTGITLSGTLANLPISSDDDNSKGYDFTAQTAFYNASMIGVGDTDNDSLDDGPYVLSFMVNKSKEESAPSIPENLRVFTTTEHEVVLKWDTPTREGRVPESYELYMSDNQGAMNVISDQNNNPIVIPRDQNYYVVTNLVAGTTYDFAIQSFGETYHSVISRPVSAKTKTSETLHFTEQPNNVNLKLEDAAEGTAIFTAEAVCDLDPSKVIKYQWQRYEAATASEQGEFKDLVDTLQGSNTNQLSIAVNEENKDAYQNPTSYRVRATVDGTYSEYSRIATLYLDNEDYEYHKLNMELTASGAEVYEIGGEYYTTKNNPFKVSTLITNADDPMEASMIPVGAAVDFYAVGSKGNTISLGSDVIKEDGTASISVTDGIIADTIDTYEITAVYQGGTVGTDRINYYLPASDTKQMKVGLIDEDKDYYRIVYHGNGAAVPYTNPRVMTNESQPVTLTPAVKYAAEFAGWYLDETLAAESVVEVMTPELFNEETTQLDVYAGWNPMQYAITYELDGGTNHADNPAFYTIDSGKITLKDPQKDGYEFGGWYTDAAFTNAGNTIASGSTGEKTFYAKWEEKKDPKPFDEDDEGTYLISNIQELREAALMVHDYYDTYGAASFRVVANIDGGFQEWSLPIGTTELPFEGSFEGDNYKIYNLILTGERDYQGVFGVVGSNGKVTNLGTMGIQSDENAVVSGGIAGMNQGTIDKCNSGLYVPVAYWITDKVQYLEEMNSRYSAKETVGGIAGVNQGNIYNCSSTATISSGNSAGGIAGINIGNISNGYNMGAVTVAAGSSGGITGNNQADGAIFNTYNSGMIAGGASAAVAGVSDNLNVSGCYYNNSNQAACTNQGLEGAVYLNSDEMRTQNFADTLNQNIGEAQGMNTWLWTQYRNGRYPKLQDNGLTSMTLTSSQYQLEVSGDYIHAASNLIVSGLDENSDEYQKLLAAAGGKQILWMKNLSLVFANENGTFTLEQANMAPYDGKLRIKIKTDHPKDLTLYHLTEDGETQQLMTETEDTQYFEATVDSLSPFALVNTKKSSDSNQTGTDKDKPTVGSLKGVLTGDSYVAIFWIALTIIAALVLVTIVIRRRRK